MDAFRCLRVLGTPTSISISSVLFLATFLFYQWLLPKPIPNIPYNEEATRSIFGDLPSMLGHLKHSKELTNWLSKHNRRHNSPIVQIFTGLFGRSEVVISDFREAQDIVLRRSKEFDKPDLLSVMFYGINPEHHTVHPISDKFRYQRKLMQDLMAPAFLQNIAAPQVYRNFANLITLWSEKLRLSEGHAFSVKDDVYETALDAIWAAVFGDEDAATVTGNQIELLSAQRHMELPETKDEEAKFARALAPPAFDMILKLTESLESVGKSPFPKTHGVLMRYLPSQRKLLQMKSRVMAEQIAKAEKRMAENKGDTSKMINAVDHMLRREQLGAEKLGRAPDFQGEVMAAELFGLLIAGHDTTSTTLLWAIKLFAAHPTVQQRLQTTLHALFPAAHSEARLPTTQEIVASQSHSQSHYLDACMEESIRVGGTAGVLTRTALTDVKILGHMIPKGTVIYMPLHGGGIMEPTFAVEEKLRSETYRKAEGKRTGQWEPQGIEVFDPERWLVDGAFDAQAGPHLTFGAGPRGCFGRKLAYLELRIAFVLIFWSFKLLDVPEKYGDWEAMDMLTHSPVRCYVRLEKA